MAEAWPDEAAIVQQPVGQLPWGHNLVLLTKLKTKQARLAYAMRASEHGWSRAVLTLHIELKAGEFEPEHAGKLNFYLSAVDATMRGEHDGPSIGILLCKTKSRVIAEYALRDTNKPMGVAEYQLVQTLPGRLEDSLPSIEQLESQLEDSSEPGIRHKARKKTPRRRRP
ncbi:PDDEXK nuclease domain-containing protein [Corallococcus interemptor]|uniref:PDDEXK nuclease domain-containing protein n=1 Tax=Corallococcus interemptor TaxID=2316720 RepID=UPI003CFC9F4E